jgi:hypothetical protein
MTFGAVMTLATAGFSGMDLSNSSSEAPITTYSVKSTSLDRLGDLLVRGERKKAYQYALDEKLWSHAMVIASSLDKDAWQEAVTEFVRTELGSTTSFDSTGTGASTGREPLRVAYSFFAGQGAGAREFSPVRCCRSAFNIALVQQMMPPSLLLNTGTQPSLGPGPPHLAQPTPVAKVSSESLSKWAETAAMLLSNPATSDSTATLVALGDHLGNNEWTAAAHVWYVDSSLARLPTAD